MATTTTIRAFTGTVVIVIVPGQPVPLQGQTMVTTIWAAGMRVDGDDNDVPGQVAKDGQ